MQFQRESEGVYRLQRRRVLVGIENDQVVIRVGGGYLTLDQFIRECCTGQEEKEEARSKISNLLNSSADSHKFHTLYISSSASKHNLLTSPTKKRDKSCSSIVY